jgi:hypothetical protein
MKRTQLDHTGTIRRISPLHTCFIESRDGRMYSFNLDKIRDYRGQRPSEVGLRPGRSLRFATSADGHVVDVEIAANHSRS